VIQLSIIVLSFPMKVLSWADEVAKLCHVIANHYYQPEDKLAVAP
jgi:hypothetical protein